MDFSEEMTDEILKIFQVESEEIISKINNSLLDLEKKPNDKDAILMLIRDAHTLKGASRMVGFNNVQAVAHKMEDVLGLAKENKILLNSQAVNILYKTIDLLADIIQKSIEKGHEIYNENITEQISILENIEDYADPVNDFDNQHDFDDKILIQNIDDINVFIPECLYILMKIETEKDGMLIKTFLSKLKELFEIFERIGLFEIKKWLEDIIVKVDFIINASNNLTHIEVEEIYQTLNNIIDKLLNVCEIFNLEVVDYYEAAFEKLSSEQANTIDKQNQQTLEVFIKEENEEVQHIDEEPIESIIMNGIIDIEGKESTTSDFIEISTEDTKDNTITLEHIKNQISVLYNNGGSPNLVRNLLLDYDKDCHNKEVKNILQKIIKIIEFANENSTKLDEETIDVIKESIEHCNNIVSNKSENADIELMFQRLEIIQQILELNKEKEEDKSFVTGKRFKIKNTKLPDFSEIFNTGEIKTLRVESSKLDTLINQVNELTITKIKTQKHLNELNAINKDMEDWQKNLTKTLNYLKHFEKKSMQLGTGNDSIPIFIKQLLSTFAENNKKVQESINNISTLHRSIQEDDTKVNVIVDNVEQMVKNIRILPFATVFHLFGRMVRDIAHEKNKSIDLQIIGSETTTDKKIIEEIKTPLIHIIRNSIDHGIETPEERMALGKDPIGKIVLSARQIENKVLIEIQDDGRGINIDKLKEKALQKGYLTQEEINLMTDEQITNIIFSPGFSTGEEVTNISGRGIGLDIVQSKIKQLNGRVRILSEVNKGCCVQIELPTTMSTIKAFLVKLSDQTFAIPMDVISFVLRKRDDEIISKKGKESIIFNGKNIQLYHLADLLNLEKSDEINDKKTILILESDNKTIALCVDKLIGDQEILLKKLSTPFYKLKNISGITTLVSGEICLILNVSDIMSAINPSKIQISSTSAKKLVQNKHYRILLVDDSITTRTLSKNILTKLGYMVETSSNPIEALEKLRVNHFDLIISDLEMPEIDGFEFLQILKTDEMFSEIPVVIVSSLIQDVNKKRAFELGAKNYFVKSSFNQEEFQDSISKLLQQIA